MSSLTRREGGTATTREAFRSTEAHPSIIPHFRHKTTTGLKIKFKINKNKSKTTSIPGTKYFVQDKTGKPTICQCASHPSTVIARPAPGAWPSLANGAAWKPLSSWPWPSDEDEDEVPCPSPSREDRRVSHGAHAGSGITLNTCAATRKSNKKIKQTQKNVGLRFPQRGAAWVGSSGMYVWVLSKMGGNLPVMAKALRGAHPPGGA